MLFGNGIAATGVNVGLISLYDLPFWAVCSHSASLLAFSSLILHAPKARGQMSLAAKRPQKLWRLFIFPGWCGIACDHN